VLSGRKLLTVGGMFCLHLQGSRNVQMEALLFAETTVNVCQLTRRHVPKDGIIRNHDYISRLSTGWAVRGSIPGGGRDFPLPS
jgi:hypothetical protein